VKLRNTSNRNLRIAAVVVGLAGAASVGRWPNHAALLQMILYSTMLFAPLLSYFWKDRHGGNFWTGIGLVIFLHCASLLLIHSYFLFRSILVIVPIALIEGTVLAITMLKTLGY
jgi:hypothetical protein